MSASAGRILTTHVGSLPRSQAVTDVLFARERDEARDVAADDEVICARRSRRWCAARSGVGIDVVSDGEMSKISYATYIARRLSGFDGDTPREPGQDLVEFPGLLRKLAERGATAKYRRPRCVAAVAVKDLGPLTTDLRNLQGAVAAAHPTAAFMNAASPGVIALFQPNDYYRTQDEYLEALAAALQAEYEGIVRAGIILQIDAPDLAMGRHTMYRDRSLEEFERLAARHIEVLNHALRNVPAERVRMHVCWGNYEGPHHHDVPLARLLPIVLKARRAGPAVRGRQPAPRARVGGIQGRAGPGGQGADPGRAGHHHQLHRAPGTGGRAPRALRRHRRARARHGRYRLRLWHLRRLRPGRAGHRVPEAALPGRGRAARLAPPVGLRT